MAKAPAPKTKAAKGKMKKGAVTIGGSSVAEYLGTAALGGVAGAAAGHVTSVIQKKLKGKKEKEGLKPLPKKEFKKLEKKTSKLKGK